MMDTIDKIQPDKRSHKDSKKCVLLEPARAYCCRQTDRPRLQVLITDSQDGVGGVVASIIQEEFEETFDLRVFFTPSADGLLQAAEAQSFDLFILNVDVMHFASRMNYIESLESRNGRALEIVEQISVRNKSPVIVLYSWGGSIFGRNITGTRYAFELPCSIYELRAAIGQCVTGRSKEFEHESNKTQ